MTLSWSFFNSAKDNRPKKQSGEWSELLALLTTIQPTPRGVEPRKVKQGIPAISGTTFSGTRAIGNAVSIDLLIFDFDNSREEITTDLNPSSAPKRQKVSVEHPATPQAVQKILSKKNLSFVIYTTFSHTTEHPKFRVVLPLAESCPPDAWDAVTEWAIDELGLRGMCDRGCIDVPVLKDVARLNFLPCSQKPRTIKFFHNTASALVLPDEVPEPVHVQPPMLPATLGHVSTPNDNDDQDWFKQYAVDFKTLDLVKVFEKLGVKIGKHAILADGEKWRVHCPWEAEHTNGTGSDDAVIFHKPGHFPTFSCQHSVHKGVLSLRNVCERAGQVMLSACADEFVPTAALPDDFNKVEHDLRQVVYAAFELTSQGGIAKVPANLTKILRLDPHWGDRLSLDEMSRNILYDGEPQGPHFVIDVQEWVQDIFHLDFKRTDIQAGLAAQAAQNMQHPVRRWLRQLEWDGVARIKHLASRCLHIDTQLAADYLTCTLIGAVRRVMEPGVKMDTITVLIGGQGNYKSTFWRVLASGEWFNDSPVNPANKDGWMVIHSSWFTELAELDGITNVKTAESVKQFTSVCRDMFRPPYGASVEVFPRSCVLVGTANRDDLLIDPTGSRRFWPIKCGCISLAWLVENREQLWAEAVQMCDAGRPHWLDAKQEAKREEDSSNFHAESPLVEQAILVAKTLSSIKPDGFSMSELLEGMQVPVAQMHSMMTRLGPELRHAKWEQRTICNRHKWFPPADLAEIFAAIAPNKY